MSAAADGLQGTRLADSGVSTAGIAAFNGDLEKFMLDDFALVAAVTLATVFLILLIMLLIPGVAYVRLMREQA